mgnify:CR=1 FL=1
MFDEYRGNSYLFGANAPFIAELYGRYLDNPAQVDESWRALFAELRDDPSLIEAADGTLHATYSQHLPAPAGGGAQRKTIKHAHFNREWVKAGGANAR